MPYIDLFQNTAKNGIEEELTQKHTLTVDHYLSITKYQTTNSPQQPFGMEMEEKSSTGVILIKITDQQNPL